MRVICPFITSDRNILIFSFFLIAQIFISGVSIRTIDGMSLSP